MKPLHVRFWSKVDRNGPEVRPGLGPCWLWTGHTEGGRGRLWVGSAAEGGMKLAPRVSWFLTHGRWPEPCALHKCDEPRCVRPDHLFEGTVIENNHDRDRKGRQRVPRGSANPNAKLHELAVSELRRRHRVGGISISALAREFGISKSQAGRIVRGESRCQETR